MQHQVPITVGNNFMRHSSVEGNFKMSYVVMNMQSEWWSVLKKKCNMNIIVTIYMYLLKASYYSTSVLHNRIFHFQNKVMHHAMVCFIHFFLMTETILSQQLDTANTLLNFSEI